MEKFSLIIALCMVLAVIAVYVMALIIYYKNHDEIKYGKQIYKAVNKKISQSIKGEYKGIKGEFETFKVIHNNLIGYFKILHDMYLDIGDSLTTQIDFVIVHEIGLIVVESKNWFGKIIGRKDDEEWIQNVNKVRHIKHYNPIKQNLNHIKNLKNKIGIENLSKYNISDENIYSIIAFGNDSDINELQISESNLKVININEFGTCLNSIIENSCLLLDESQIDEINNLLEPMTKVDENIKLNHIINIERMKIKN